MKEEAKYRKAINFDLDTKALKKYYPNESNPNKNYRQAYKDIKKFMLDNGFEHRQWSGYRSKNAMKSSDLLVFNKDLYVASPWLRKCANQIDATNISKEYSLIEMDKQQQDMLKTAETEIKSVSDTKDTVDVKIERQIGGTFTVESMGIKKEYSISEREETLTAIEKDFGFTREEAGIAIDEAKEQSAVDNELAKQTEQGAKTQDKKISNEQNNEIEIAPITQRR